MIGVVYKKLKQAFNILLVLAWIPVFIALFFVAATIVVVLIPIVMIVLLGWLAVFIVVPMDETS